MLEWGIIGGCTFVASLIAFYAGSGLGTIVMPVMALFMPLPLAIALTAVVHGVHNALKTALFWSQIDWPTALRFGVAAVVASVPGALLLSYFSTYPPLAEYTLFGVKGTFSLLHLLIGLLLILFATLGLFPRKIEGGHTQIFGGVISGFLGGFSGSQGAFRSLFLVHIESDTKAFIGTSALIATAVDVGRLITYSLSLPHLFAKERTPLVAIALGSAIAGIVVGRLFLHKIRFTFIKTLVVCLVYLFGVLFLIGMI